MWLSTQATTLNLNLNLLRFKVVQQSSIDRWSTTLIWSHKAKNKHTDGSSEVRFNYAIYSRKPVTWLEAIILNSRDLYIQVISR